MKCMDALGGDAQMMPCLSSFPSSVWQVAGMGRRCGAGGPALSQSPVSEGN